jgi:hypothetical protein
MVKLFSIEASSIVDFLLSIEAMGSRCDARLGAASAIASQINNALFIPWLDRKTSVSGIGIVECDEHRVSDRLG